MTATQKQLDALAALVGITPETHKHLFKLRLHCCECGSESRLAHGSTWVCSNDSCPAFDYGFYGAKGYKQAQRLVADLPDPLGPDADGVWAVPMMCWLQEHDFNPSVVGLDFGHKSKFKFAADCFSMETMTRTNNFYDDTMTSALLQACLAARVPEICDFREGRP